MSNEAQQFLVTYDALPTAIQKEVVDAILRHRGDGGVERESADHQRLSDQIRAGIDSPGVPTEDAMSYLRSTAAALTENQS